MLFFRTLQQESFFSINFSCKLVNTKIIIADAQGKVVYQTISNGNRLELDISSFNAGVYFVSINENGALITQKIIKQ